MFPGSQPSTGSGTLCPTCIHPSPVSITTSWTQGTPGLFICPVSVFPSGERTLASFGGPPYLLLTHVAWVELSQLHLLQEQLCTQAWPMRLVTVPQARLRARNMIWLERNEAGGGGGLCFGFWENKRFSLLQKLEEETLILLLDRRVLGGDLWKCYVITMCSYLKRTPGATWSLMSTLWKQRERREKISTWLELLDQTIPEHNILWVFHLAELTTSY